MPGTAVEPGTVPDEAGGRRGARGRRCCGTTCRSRSPHADARLSRERPREIVATT